MAKSRTVPTRAPAVSRDALSQTGGVLCDLSVRAFLVSGGGVVPCRNGSLLQYVSAVRDASRLVRTAEPIRRNAPRPGTHIPPYTVYACTAPSFQASVARRARRKQCLSEGSLIHLSADRELHLGDVRLFLSTFPDGEVSLAKHPLLAQRRVVRSKQQYRASKAAMVRVSDVCSR